ncbi:transcriptional regulator with XRE-family HTH domain [Streptomyces sp. SAI-208]|jgi:transcriptional regulator with XRE-family HTH domain|uniref:helix-turn-helix domain-containing protein n=1 Tax=unclassified Streptomyces TaxID=2593676 RepID=UPI0024731572|nr:MULTISPECIES: helix-turn-helix transcriptional regulator [unclassified Streptomyces]MDH6516852.1 transcriptional regulator with XRE-family HTH domain [Streptomyces sp. SAI-090]MDH6549067.1 transcriptional regulator with XRE-family HTH domain [Streptomyces sp. SAI-041]MDH6568135.1 transcriptional regulator with XRE-family HTH domain [Streptomyces sp. SAI-117]MDH6586918.1 transcriptional regulator with XRE-family HTH domain [Streptomyces sp. SAI-133]MDH6607671.1 transcriptional regulator with
MDDMAEELPGSGSLDRRAELSEFLRTRRARLKPEDVGLPDFGRHRRVPGLRREELAQLAGVSVAYYTRLEQGNGRNVSTEVLGSIARALRLTDAEHAHLTHLAKPKQHKKKPAARTEQVRRSIRHLLDSMDVPAYVSGRRSDILAWNRMAAAVFGDWSELPVQDRNWARLVFLRPEYRELFVPWEQKATDMVSYLRMDAGCHPDDPRLSALVGELSVKSEEFRRLWATHDVKEKNFGVKQLRHPLVGDLTLHFDSFPLSDGTEQALITYHAEPGTPSADALRLLASWGADATRAGESARP